jgi:hypothetical protein
MKMSRGTEIRFAGPAGYKEVGGGDFWLGFNFSARQFIVIEF